MPRHSILPLVAAAALLAAPGAFAAGVQADLSLGETLSHGTTDGDKNAGVFGASLGYRFDANLAVQATTFAQFDLYRNLGADRSTARYGFDRFFGVQGLGYVPVGSALELVGGVGIGRSKLNNGFVGSPDRTNTDGLLTAGLQWRVARHFNLGLDVNYLTKTEVSALMLHSQWTF